MSNHIEYTVTSGTGRFLNSGSIVDDGTPDFRNGAARADLARDGTLSLPAVLRQLDRLDAAVVADDGAAFQAALADDLVVNTPQNTVSLRARIVGRNAAGQISDARYDGTVEHAGTRGDMDVLMGEERVVPKGSASNAGQEVRRRFTELWCLIDHSWQLTGKRPAIPS